MLESQLAILHDKREKGLQEIQKLNKLVESLRNGKSLLSSGNDSSLKSLTAQPNVQNKVGSTSSQNNNLINKQEIFNQMQDIRQQLDQLYKEIIITLSDQKILEASLDSKGVPKFSDKLIKIEKKTNDIILIVREFIETLE